MGGVPTTPRARRLNKPPNGGPEEAHRPPIQRLAARIQTALRHEEPTPLHTIGNAAMGVLVFVAVALFALFCVFAPGIPYGWVDPDSVNATSMNATSR